MKTKVRIQGEIKSTVNGYCHYYIDILDRQFEGAEYLETVGQIIFQSGHMTPEQEKEGKWYGMKMECKSEKVRHFATCAKILQYIYKHQDYSRVQPEDILRLIGAEEYRYYAGELIPVSYEGYKAFKIMKGEDWHVTIFAPSDALACKEMKRRKYDTAKYTLAPSHDTVKFN